MLVRPGEGEAVTRTATRTLDILCDLPALSAVNIRHAPGEPGPDLHVHREHTDAFYVLEGTLVVSLGPDATEHELGPGSLALAPANVIHTFRNGGDDWLSILNLHAPGGGFNAMLRGARDGVPVAVGLVRAARGRRASGFGRGREPSRARASRSTPAETGCSSRRRRRTGTGPLSVTEMTVAPGFPGPPLHLHRGFADCFLRPRRHARAAPRRGDGRGRAR